jgi:hypothetical protein
MRAGYDRPQEMSVLRQRANIELKAGKLDAARQFVEEVLRYARAVGSKAQQAGCLRGVEAKLKESGGG